MLRSRASRCSAAWAAGLALTALVAMVPSEAAAGGGMPVPFQRGITVGEWGPTAYKPRATKRVLRRLARRYHVDTVTLFIVWMQDDASSTEIGPGEKTARTRNLIKAIRYARAEGMNVILRPYVDRSDGGWRGYLAPASIDRWFNSYTRFVLRFARLAQRQKVHGFVVGSEMASLSGAAERWRALVQRVRRRFHGFVTYQANWFWEAEHVTWWGSLDAISIAAYYELTQQVDYSVDDLVAGWKGSMGAAEGPNWFAQVEKLHDDYDRPVMFGEIGYRTIAGTATRPWNIELAGARSVQAQTQAYEAALQVWYRVPWFRGFNWWYLSTQPGLLAGRPGADHRPSPAALRVLAKWYKQPRKSR